MPDVAAKDGTDDNIDNVCIPNGLEMPVKLFSYPTCSYGASIH